MVLGIVASLVGLVKVRLLHTNIDNYVFRLHYRWTTTFCYLACALVAASDYIGKAIQCYEGSGAPAPKPINTYCWIMSTFTINTTNTDGSHYSHRGSNFEGTGTYDPIRHTKTYHAYYQWVPFVLFFQGCLFYLPHLMWKASEGKTADTLLQGLQFNSMDDDREVKRNNIVKYLQSSWGRNGRYFSVYIICETLNFINVIGQMFLLDTFFGGVFMTYGTQVLKYMVEDEDDGMHDPLITTFPRVTKCDFYKYGPSGSVERRDAACILPQNMLNEKVFITMWFWFVILATFTAIQIVWRLAIACSPVLRVRVLERRGKISATPEVEREVRLLHLGDYFLLDILGRNLDACNFQEVLLTALGCKDSDDNDNTYHSYCQPEEDDPLARKRQMEHEDTPV
ncbi:innexin inx3 [Cherax quadricarinatus]|uniref:innexin inx3 n=1 Tax=Cherax quadricarinatus TaxID=27406 RepID=UPI0023785AA1|nr:innexin inx3-like [Cherax quadricarinatus]